MKRFITAIVAITLITTSCLPKHEEDPTAAGVTIYDAANDQQKYAIDFLYTAMKFNILMTEAKAQEIIDFDDVKVTQNEEQVGLQSHLFGAHATISSTDSITYTISYQNSAYEIRNGVLTINTAGKTLDELSENDTWYISLDKNIPLPFEFVTSQYAVYVKSVEMYITPAATLHSWDVTMDSFQSYFTEDVISDWDLNMNITQLDKTTLLYNDYFASRFQYRGGSEGKTMADQILYYTIDPQNPIEILPSCEFGFLSAGNINVRIDESTPVDESKFPSREVEIKVRYTDNCKTDVTVIYNGVTKHFTNK